MRSECDIDGDAAAPLVDGRAELSAVAYVRVICRCRCKLSSRAWRAGKLLGVSASVALLSALDEALLAAGTPAGRSGAGRASDGVLPSAGNGASGASKFWHARRSQRLLKKVLVLGAHLSPDACGGGSVPLNACSHAATSAALTWGGGLQLHRSPLYSMHPREVEPAANLRHEPHEFLDV